MSRRPIGVQSVTVSNSGDRSGSTGGGAARATGLGLGGRLRLELDVLPDQDPAHDHDRQRGRAACDSSAPRKNPPGAPARRAEVVVPATAARARPGSLRPPSSSGVSSAKLILVTFSDEKTSITCISSRVLQVGVDLDQGLVERAGSGP